MLKKLLNQADITIEITVEGPLLIKSGREGGADPALPDMQFVRTNGRIYLPGSSLKGVFRSYAEKIARTAGARCCNPFENDTSSRDCFCGKLLEKDGDGAAIYKKSCVVCRLFGSTAMASRIKFNDAHAIGDLRSEIRTGVAIDRMLGSVAHGPFDFEVITSGTFETSIHLRNFELWQLGLLGLVLRDMSEGLIPIGFGKSRGLGDVKAKVKEIKTRYLGGFTSDPETTVLGIGAIVKGKEAERYGFSQNDILELETKGEEVKEEIFGTQVVFGEEALMEIFQRSVECWKGKVENEQEK